MLFDDLKLHSESEYNFLNRKLEGFYNLSFLIDRYFLPSVGSYKEFLKYFNPLKVDNAKPHQNLHKVSFERIIQNFEVVTDPFSLIQLWII